MKKIVVKNSFYQRNKRLKEHGMDYQQYLKSDLWEKIKEELKKDKNYQACVCCKRKGQLHMHHIKYKDIFKEKLGVHKKYIRALCETCHEYNHVLCNERGWGLKQAIRRVTRLFEKGILLPETSFMNKEQQKHMLLHVKRLIAE